VAQRALASLWWRVACCIIGFVAVLLFEQVACGSHGLFASFAPAVAWRLPYVRPGATIVVAARSGP